MEESIISKILFVWFILLAPLARGQNVSIGDIVQETPSCALPCFLNAIPNPSCLAGVDQLSSCICPDSALLTNVSTCVRLTCNISDQITSKTLLDQLCQAFPQESQQMTLMLTSILAIAISVPSIGLRWLARIKTSKLGWDDYMALVAATLLLVLAALQLESTSLGFGRHVWNVNPANAIPLLKIYWISQGLYAVVQLVSMVSILALYSRVFPTRWFRLSIRVGMILLLVHNIVYTGMVMFRCIPLDAIWDVRISGRCLDLNLIGFTGAVLHITEHFTVLLLPIWELWKLKLSRRKKIQLVLLFTLGSFSCVTSVIRIKYVAIFDPTADASWDTAPVVVWSLVEVLSAVVCINLPPCRQFIGKLLPRQLLTAVGTTMSTHNKSNESKHIATIDAGTNTEAWRSVTSVVSSSGDARPESFKGELREQVSWLDSPLPSPPPRNFSRKAASVRTLRYEDIAGSRPLEGGRRTRPYSAHTLDVEIDLSDLGLKELLQRRQTWVEESKGTTKSPRSG